MASITAEALLDLTRALEESSYPLGDPSNYVDLMHWLDTYVGIRCEWPHEWLPDWTALTYEGPEVISHPVT